MEEFLILSKQKQYIRPIYYFYIKEKLTVQKIK